jgi:hypothetical protein
MIQITSAVRIQSGFSRLINLKTKVVEARANASKNNTYTRTFEE